MGAKAKSDIAPVLRTAFLAALDIVKDKRGLTLPELMADLIEQEGLLAVMDRMSKFAIKEKNVNTSVDVSGRITHVGLSRTDELLAEIAARRPVRAFEEPVQDRPVLSPPVRVQS